MPYDHALRGWCDTGPIVLGLLCPAGAWKLADSGKPSDAQASGHTYPRLCMPLKQAHCSLPGSSGYDGALTQGVTEALSTTSSCNAMQLPPGPHEPFQLGLSSTHM